VLKRVLCLKSGRIMPVMLRPSGKARKIAYAILGTPSNDKKTRKPRVRIEMGLGEYVDKKIK